MAEAPAPKPKFNPFDGAEGYIPAERDAVAALAVDPRQALSRADINAPPTDNLQPEGTAAAAGPPPGLWQQFGRQVGLGGRELIQGALSLPGTAIDATSMPMQAFGIPSKSSAQRTAEALDAFGLPREETPREKIVGSTIEGISSALASYGLGVGMQSPAFLASLGARVLPTAARTAGPVADAAAVPSTLTAFAQPGSAPAITRAVGQTLAANPLSQAVIGGVQGGTQGGLNAAGVNPYAAALLGIGAGGLAGAAMPNASSGFANASDRALAQTAREKYNIPIDPATTAVPGVRQIFGATKILPGSGAAKETSAVQNAVNREVGKTFGATVGEDGKLTPEVMTAARDSASGIYQNVAANSAPLLDVTTNRLLTTARSEADKLGADGAPIMRIIDNVREIAARNGGRIPSDWLVNALGSKSALSRGAAGTGAAKGFFGDVQDALRENLTRYATPGQQEQLTQANQFWKNMKTVEGLVATGGGDIDLAKFASTFARNKYQRVAYTGGDPQLAELADIIDRFLKPPASLAGQVAHYGTAPAALGVEHVLEHGLSIDPGTAATTLAYGTAATGAGATARALLRRGALAPMPPTLPEVWGRSALAAPTGATALFNPRLQQPLQFRPF